MRVRVSPLAWCLLACVLGAVRTHGGLGEVCGGLCSCEEKEGALTVGCENRGIVSLAQIGPLRSPSFQLLLTGNLLRKLRADDFAGYTGVTTLHLGDNDVSEIEAGAFNGLRGLRRLHLNNNKIDALRGDTLAGLEELEYLQMDYNYISAVEADALHGLRRLTVLILNDNLLSSLPGDVFRNAPLTHLDLRGNRLRALPYTGLLEHMGRVVELQLEENPWNCSCELIALKAWLESIAYTALVGEVVCETPFRLHGRDLDEVSKQELCPRRAVSEYEARPPPPPTAAYPQTTPAGATSSAVLGSSSRPTKGTRQTNRTRSKPTSRVPGSPYNYGPIIALQTKSPVPLDCPAQCTCNLQISDLGLNVNCQERKIESISDLEPKPYNPKKLYLTGNYVPVVRRSDFVEAEGLDLLHLGNNRISAIHDRAFGDLASLRRLYLNGNLIERLTAEMFFGLQNLQYLYLEYNKIKEVAGGAFRPVPNMQLLFLNNNLLRALPAGVFSGVPLSRLNLRSNQFRGLPVGGVLDQLESLVQVDLSENPWDCSCHAAGMKVWLGQLGAGTAVNEVLCATPGRLAGRDVRGTPPERLCPDRPDTPASPVSRAGSGSEGVEPVTTETPLMHGGGAGGVPLSVLILSLLLVFMVAVLVAAGLLVAVVRRRRKSRSDRASANASDVGSFSLRYSLYASRPAPGAGPPASHLYEYVPHPVGHMCKNPIYRSREGAATVGDYPELHELRVSYGVGDDRGPRAAPGGPAYTVSTIQPREPREPPPAARDAERFFRGIVEPDGTAGRHHGYPAYPGPYGYGADFDVRRQFPRQDDRCESALYDTGAAHAPPRPNEYLELKAKLQSEPDYLEVLEKQTTFSQF